MNLRAKLYLLAIAVCVSCIQEEVAKREIPSVESLHLTDYPNINFYFKKDLIPEVIYNEVELPITAREKRLNFRLKSKNAEKIEVYIPGLNRTEIVETDTFSLNYQDNFVIRLTTEDEVEKVCTVSLKTVQPFSPEYKSFSIDLNPSGNSPLTGRLSVSSDQPVTVTYIVRGQDGADLTRKSQDYKTDSQVDVYGLYPNYTNNVLIRIENQEGLVSSREIFIKTGPLPEGMPQSEEIKINKLDYQQVNTQFILLFPQRTNGLIPASLNNYPIAIDNYGKVRWYLNIPVGTMMKPLKNGHWLLASKDVFKEVDLLGNVYNITNLPLSSHHDFEELPDGSIVYLADRLEANNTLEDKVCIIEYPSGTLKDEINLYNILDPLRPWLPNHNETKDWLHSNSIFYDLTDNSIIISNRHQSSVCKIDLTSKALKWILSDPTHWKSEFQPYLLAPTGTAFEYSYGQHSAFINPFKPNSLMLFDNGNFRSYTSPLEPGNSYSRIVEYGVNEQNKTVTQNFQFGKEYGSIIYAPYVGNVECLTPDRFLICYGGILKDASNNPMNLVNLDGTLNTNIKNQVRFFEIDRNQNVYLDISLQVNKNSTEGMRSYRAYKIELK